ncbi:hypothetical protein, partial [Enterococcus faecium]|uniref:hypothetical protein n=1 Tax=Enterococcus faecium TaxID=1352 RepID=UPI001C0EEA95
HFLSSSSVAIFSFSYSTYSAFLGFRKPSEFCLNIGIPNNSQSLSCSAFVWVLTPSEKASEKFDVSTPFFFP